MKASQSPVPQALNAVRAVALALVLACLAFTVTAQEREGVNVGKRSAFTNLVPAQEVEKMAGQQYKQVLEQADSKNALAPPSSEELKRLRTIAQRLIPFATPWNERASQWQWEVNLIGSKQINAYCMPGGKIAFYTGILRTLQLTDDEAAMVMGHEMAHALREHARERMGKSTVTSGAARLGGALLSGWLGVRPARGHHPVGKNGRCQQGRAAAVAVHPPGQQHPDCRHAGRAAQRDAALPARQGGADRQALVKTLIDLFFDGITLWHIRPVPNHVCQHHHRRNRP